MLCKLLKCQSILLLTFLHSTFLLLKGTAKGPVTAAEGSEQTYIHTDPEASSMCATSTLYFFFFTELQVS